MLLDKQVRNHLVKVFNIPRTGITEIRDQEIIRDGYSDEDLKAITLEKMNEYIGSTEVFPRAWELTCSKARYELNPPIDLTAISINTQTNDNTKEESKQDERPNSEGNGDEGVGEKAKRGRPKNI